MQYALEGSGTSRAALGHGLMNNMMVRIQACVSVCKCTSKSRSDSIYPLSNLL